MPSLGDSAFIFILALLLFGPKKLPELARQLGKLMAEFRRASNEFRMQMEDELRISEQADRQKEIAAIEAAAPLRPAIEAPTIEAHSIAAPSEPAPIFPADAAEEIPDPLDAHPHMPPPAPGFTPVEASAVASEALASEIPAAAQTSGPVPEPVREPVPIATSGTLTMRPPKTGMPFAKTMGTPPATSTSAPANESSASLSSIFDSIPHAPTPEASSAPDTLAPAPMTQTEAPQHG